MQMETLTAYLHRQDISSTYHSIIMGYQEICLKSLLTQFPDVQLVHTPFTHADPWSEELGSVSVVVCLPPSSLSTVVQPLDILHQEGGRRNTLIGVLTQQSHFHSTSFTCVSPDFQTISFHCCSVEKERLSLELYPRNRHSPLPMLLPVSRRIIHNLREYLAYAVLTSANVSQTFATFRNVSQTFPADATSTPTLEGV